MIPKKLTRTIQIGIRSVVIHKLRSSLTTLGIVLGVASVIVMLAIGEGARTKAIEQIELLGATNIMLRSVKPKEGAPGLPGGGNYDYGLTIDDLRRIRKTIPTVVSATPTRESRREFGFADRRIDGLLVAVTPGYLEQNRLKISRGRFVMEIDNDRFENVVVLAAGVAKALFPLDDPLGQSIRIESDYFRVVGVTQRHARSISDNSDPGAHETDREAFIPFETDRVRFGKDVNRLQAATFQTEEFEIGEITVAVDKTNNVKQTAKIIEGLIGDFHPNKDVRIDVPLAELEKVEETQQVYSLVLGGIASISLLVGGIGIMNIMLATVTERTREIGIRRALGAKRRDIISQFLIEAVMLSGIGGLVGVAFGITLSYLVTQVSQLETIISTWSVLLAFIISATVGLVFGTYPARRAAFLDPIEALRHE